jgi:hypothetical protein
MNGITRRLTYKRKKPNQTQKAAEMKIQNKILIKLHCLQTNEMQYTFTFVIYSSTPTIQNIQNQDKNRKTSQRWKI